METAGRLGGSSRGGSGKGGAGVRLQLGGDCGSGTLSRIPSEQWLSSCSPGSQSTWTSDGWSREAVRDLSRRSSH